MTITSTSWRRLATALTIIAAAGLAVGACGSGDSGSSSNKNNTSGGVKGAAALVAKGLQEQAAGDLAGARRDYTQAIADDPKNKFAHYNLGLIQQTAGDKVGAENSYRAALNIDPEFPQPLYNLAILRTAANAFPEAIDLYRRVIAASPKAADAHFNLGLLLRQTGNVAEGNLEVQAAVKLDPSLASRAKAQGIPLKSRADEPAAWMKAPSAEEAAAADDILRGPAEPRRTRAERLASRRSEWVKFLPLGLVAIAVLFNLFVMRAEVRPVAPPNDTSVHVSFVRFAEQRIQDGKLVFDGWYPRLSAGLPIFHHYQPLAAIVSGAIATQVGAARTVAWSSYLLLCLLPICFYWAARLFGFDRWVAGIAALLVPLISSVTLYGYEHGSFQWRGNGIWTALWGMWLLPLTLAFTYRAISRGRAYALAALFLGLTIMVHFLTGYLALLALGVWVIVKPSELLRRIGRAAVVAGGGLLVAAWVVIPLLADAKWASRSEYNVNSFWFDSAGGHKVMWWLGTGQVFDYRHWPVVTVLGAVGVVVCIWRFRDERSRALLGFTALSLLLFCGRDTVGFVVDRLPGGKDLLLHRYIMGVHLGGIVLAAVGAAWLAQLVFTFVRRHLKGVPSVAIGVGMLVVVLAACTPVWRERTHYDELDALGIDAQQVSDKIDGADFTALVDTAKSLGDGRIYAGRPGHTAVIGQVPTYQYVLHANADVVGFNLRTPSLMSDPETRFDSSNAALFDLFNARYIIQPSAQAPEVPATLLQASGRWGLWSVPTSGYLQVVDTTTAIIADRTNIGSRTAGFLSSTLPAQRLIPVIAFDGTRAALPTAAGGQPAGPAGVITQQHSRPDDGIFGGTVIANRNAVVMLKATYDPHMEVTVDGRPAKTQMLAPSFIGVAVTPGQHDIEFRYVAFGYYWALFLIGALTLAALALVPRYGRRWIEFVRGRREAHAPPGS